MPLPQTREMLTTLHALRAPESSTRKQRSFGFAEKAIAIVLCVSSLGLYVFAVLFVLGFSKVNFVLVAANYFGDVAIIFGVLWLLVIAIGSWLEAWPAVRYFTLVQSDMIDRDEANGPVFRQSLGAVSTYEVEERIERIKHHMSELKSRGLFIAAIGGAVSAAAASKLFKELTADLKSFDLSFIGVAFVASAAIAGLFYRYAELRFGPLLFELERILAALRVADAQDASIVVPVSSGSPTSDRETLPSRQGDGHESGRLPLTPVSTFGLAAVLGWLLGALSRRR